METDLQYYTRLIIEELRAARRAGSAQERRAHEQRATAFTLQMHRIENTPAAKAHPAARLRPALLAA